ncbi:Methylamine dehydrogenase accessory protein MauD [Alloalcanivorax dieselolei B5]|uniref:Methylamine dehydrogenase accessory protein MauD n=1 Tax=Alcanivorax dieselolei (strain DSM 16502 / CGMCC 1.3690 / MCCC 1A00001 / B-5) TaxID=930169 RepID=K0C7H8_ALCDB|nr:redoxin domain-containing protein [Alloalcanivorax dieselolei]AFT68450.1 Methylamine dehydrogenase accessory protein MauD [Alloalcanivorax dieselolei B5]GGJ99579.1 hypothetical protein GCM10007426_30880 [Alloalcanivorax dieselolei]
MTLIYFLLAFLTLAVLTLGVAFLALARQTGILFERIAPMGALMNDSGPKVGDTSPAFSLTSLTGGAVEVGQHREKAQLLFFLSPTCPICKKLLPVLKSIKDSERRWLDITLASDGEPERHQRFIHTAALGEFDYVLSTELGLAYRVSRLPFAVVIGRTGVVSAKGLVNNREQLESLFNAHDMDVESIQGYLEKTQP